MTFDAPQPFEEALRKLSERTIVTSPLRSAQWRDKVAAGLRDRAFFSATVENARVLQTMRDYLGDFLAKAIDPQTGGLKAQGRAEFVADMRELCIREGIGKVDPKTGEIDPEIDESDLTDLRSMARLQLIFDTQTESANEYGYWSQGNDPDVLNAYPAQRFIRVRPVRTPRPLHAANEGAVRRKDDLAFWLSMNPDFGVPWGPWGYGSGMGVEDVDRIEAERLGLVGRRETLTSPERQLNDRLSAGVRDLSPEMVSELRRIFGDQVRVGNGKLEWTGSRSRPAPARTANPGGIASMDQARARFLDDLGVPKVLDRVTDWREWGQPLPEVQRIGMLRVVYSEFQRLVKQYPTLAGKLAEFAATDSPRGLAHIGGPRMATKNKPWSKQSWDTIYDWEKQNRRKWGTERKESQVEDNFRHELGHILSTPDVLDEWRKGPMQRGPQWFAENVSEYAAGKQGGGIFEYESIAECFAVFTRAEYDGSLPPDIEAVMLKMMK